MDAAPRPTLWTPGTELPPIPSFGMCDGLEKDLDSMQTIASLATPVEWLVPTPPVVPLQWVVIRPTALLEQLLGPITIPGPSRWANVISGLPCRVLHMELYTEGPLFTMAVKFPVYELMASIRTEHSAKNRLGSRTSSSSVTVPMEWDRPLEL